MAGRVIPGSSVFTWHCSVWASFVFTAVKQSRGTEQSLSDFTYSTCSSFSWSLIIPNTVSSIAVAIFPTFSKFLFPLQWRIRRRWSLRWGGRGPLLFVRLWNFQWKSWNFFRILTVVFFFLWKIPSRTLTDSRKFCAAFIKRTGKLDIVPSSTARWRQRATNSSYSSDQSLIQRLSSN